MIKLIEILAPAGSMDAVKAAVRTGANAVYLGGEELNARHGKKNFSFEELKEVVTYCHGRSVGVHLTLNTIVFDEELPIAEEAIRQGAAAGVDAFIIQDLAMAHLATVCAPDIQRHGSTQMAVHNLWGVKQLEKLGFSRAVLARELSKDEIAAICAESPIEIEVFVHGALCSSVSGQCYISGLIGGRSGNRGRCAQTCRLPFASEKAEHALSLKDLSVISEIPTLRDLGVSSFKIEGRLKRPEYVAAAVTAAVEVLEGIKPDYDTLEAIFSRSGFTDGYLSGDLGDEMFGTRTREDVVSAKGTLKELAGLYYQEQPRIPVDFFFQMKGNCPAVLQVTTGEHTVIVSGPLPQLAQRVATTQERVAAALEKTGNTPFYSQKIECELEQGYMLPVSQINQLRREALDELLEQLEQPQPKEFHPYLWEEQRRNSVGNPALRVRFAQIAQFSSGVFSQAEKLIFPIEQAREVAAVVTPQEKEKVLLELPRLSFSKGGQERLKEALLTAKNLGFHKVMVGDYGSFYHAKEQGLQLYGDFGFNIVNEMALGMWKDQGLSSATMSIEYAVGANKGESALPKGILSYGYLPSMIFRNRPEGMGEETGILIDRLGKEFLVEKQGEAWVLYNCVPLYLGDQPDVFSGFDFHTLYFTRERPEECSEIFCRYEKREKMTTPFTRGNYSKRIL